MNKLILLTVIVCLSACSVIPREIDMTNRTVKVKTIKKIKKESL